MSKLTDALTTLFPQNPIPHTSDHFDYMILEDDPLTLRHIIKSRGWEELSSSGVIAWYFDNPNHPGVTLELNLAELDDNGEAEEWGFEYVEDSNNSFVAAFIA